MTSTVTPPSKSREMIEGDGLPLLGFINGDIRNGRCRDLARDMVEDQHFIPYAQLLDGDHAAVRERDERIGSKATVLIAVHSQRDIRIRHGEAILRLAVFLYGRRAALIAEILVFVAGVCDLGDDLLARAVVEIRPCGRQSDRSALFAFRFDGDPVHLLPASVEGDGARRPLAPLVQILHIRLVTRIVCCRAARGKAPSVVVVARTRGAGT